MPRSRSLAELAGQARSSGGGLTATDATGESRGSTVDSISIPSGGELSEKVKKKVGDELTSGVKDLFGLADKGPQQTGGGLTTTPEVAKLVGPASPIGGTAPTAVLSGAELAAPAAASALGAGGGGGAAGLASGAGAAAGGGAAAGAGAGAAAGGAAGGAAAGGAPAWLAIFCWVAAEYYPRHSVEWVRCRKWVLSHPLLTKVYAKHGETFALFLRTHPVAYWLFRPMVAFARRRGASL
jgi:hypothetical protein